MIDDIERFERVCAFHTAVRSFGERDASTILGLFFILHKEDAGDDDDDEEE